MLQSPIGKHFLTGLIGAPIAHSASPAMHERAADALGARCHYQLIEVAGAGRDELRALLDDVRRLGFAGVNVTFPYKEAVVALLDDLSPQARAIGAVNTVVVRAGRLIGYNTDTSGFERAIGQLPAAGSPAVHRRADRRGRRRQGDSVRARRARRRCDQCVRRDPAKAEHLVAQLRSRQNIRVARPAPSSRHPGDPEVRSPMARSSRGSRGNRRAVVGNQGRGRGP